MKLGHSVAEVGQGRLQECDHRGVVSNGGGGGGGGGQKGVLQKGCYASV